MPRFVVTWKDGAQETICGENPQLAFITSGYKTEHLDAVKHIRNLPPIRVLDKDGNADTSGLTQEEYDAFERLWLAIEKLYPPEHTNAALHAAMLAWKQALRNPSCT